MDHKPPFDVYGGDPKGSPKGKYFHFVDNHLGLIVLLVAIILLVGMFVCTWYLGYTRATVKSQSAIAALRIENTQLSSEAAAWKRKALSSGLVSADTAMEILLAEYPDNRTLVTLEYPFSDCARFTSSQKISDWEIPFTEKAFTMKWNGTVTAGVNLERVSIKVDESGEKLIVTIPKAELISFQVDDSSFELLDEKNNLFNPISLDDLLQLDVKIEENMKNRAVENGMLITAQDNARVYITDILRSDPEIGSYYEIEFKMK